MSTATKTNLVHDFFISYTNTDKAWAVWIAVELERAGYTTVIQAFDFRPGSDFAHEMQQAVGRAKRMIAVISPDYFASAFAEAEWRTTFATDPSGAALKLLPVRVRPVQPAGLLRTRVYIDLHDLPEDAAREALLNGVAEDFVRPTTALFPGSAATPYPGRSPQQHQLPKPSEGRDHAPILRAEIDRICSNAVCQGWKVKTNSPTTLRIENRRKQRFTFSFDPNDPRRSRSELRTFVGTLRGGGLRVNQSVRTPVIDALLG